MKRFEMTAEEFFNSTIDSCSCDCGNYINRQMIEFAEEYAKHIESEPGPDFREN